MSALQSELMARQWITPSQYGLIYSLARITPGTNILAFCAGVGWQILGLRGALLAVLAVSIPSAALVFLLTAGYGFWKSNPFAMAAISGMLAAAIGMMATGAFLLLRPQFRRGRFLSNGVRAVVVSVAALTLTLRFGLSPVQVLALAAITGLLWRV